LDRRESAQRDEHRGFIFQKKPKLAKMMIGHAPIRSRCKNSKSEASATPRMKKAGSPERYDDRSGARFR
jgi:hypothetical protein